MRTVGSDQVEPRQAVASAIGTGILYDERHPLTNPTLSVALHPVALDMCGDSRLGVGGHPINRFGKYRLDGCRYGGQREWCQRRARADSLGLLQGINSLPLCFDLGIDFRIGGKIEEVAERGSSRNERG